MASQLKRMDVQRAADDVRRRTLDGLQPLSKCVYLASMRDSNNGRYYHDGLADQFSAEVASEALADCHTEAFQELVKSSIESLVDQLERYIDGSRSPASVFLPCWNKLQPYRMLIPVATDPFTAEFLFSNLRVALAKVEERLGGSHWWDKVG